MKRILFIITIFFAAILFSQTTVAGPDQYIGDTAIYSGSTSTLRPNVLLLFDNSAIMASAAATGDPYWPYDAFAEPFEGSNVAVGDTDGWFNNTYWTNTAISGSVKWARSTSYEQEGSYSLFSAGNISSSDMALVTRSFGVISSPSTTLSFYHTYKFHTSGGACNDGGTLEYSSDGGTTWAVVPDSAFTAGGFNSGSYTGGTVSGTDNPIAGKKAWCGGSLAAMTQVTVNLGGISGLAGNIVKLRWHAGYDNTSSGSKPSNGWYIDSILISNIAYSGSREPWYVYKLTACTGGTCTYVSHITGTSWNLSDVSCISGLTRPSLAAPLPSAPASGNAKGNLQYSGNYSGAGAASLKNNGTCGNGGADATYLGNLLNYNAAAGSGTLEAAVRIVRDAVASVVGSTRETVNFGLMVIGQSGNKGGKIVKPVANVSSDSAYNAFIAVLPGTGSTGSSTTSNYVEGPSPAESLLTGTVRPLAEALHDAGAYFKSIDSSRTNVYSNRICAEAAVSGSLTSPIQYSCQKNYVIVVSRGAPDSESGAALCTGTVLGAAIGDYDGDGNAGDCGTSKEHMMDDVALAIYAKNSAGNDNVNFDMSAPLDGTQRVITTVVQVFESSTLSQRAADSSHGRGLYKLASNANELSAALTEAMANIVLEADTSFVAPVVPVSPENRTYSGSRVYLGFFKPISQKPWYGNLKKYGINSSLEIVDKDNVVATNSDGSFKSTATSYWSTSADGGAVESGGAGELLWSRDFTTSPRSIYTYNGTTTSLTDATNAFTAANTGLSSTLIDFVKGIDSYDDDGDGNLTEKRGWLLGDILHSKPLVVNYKTYVYTNESDCNENKTIIYVGGNDGMLHAFKDCDGSEAWAFIPQDLLSNLSYLRGQTHTYFMDSAASLYKYDMDSDGNIETADNDKAVIIFGERRGGGLDTAPTKGYYYALDVSDPAAPVYMWRLSNTESPSGTNTDYSELGETWSEPKIAKMKISVSGTDVDKVVAIIGAGYDNIHEDARYGATQTFSDASSVTITATGSGAVTSSGLVSASSLTNPKGRGIYIVEIAQLASTTPFAPSFTNSGRKIWGYTYADNSAMTFSIPSEVSALDTDYNGYVDRLYVGDTGGNIWRFNVSSNSTASWSARKIFSANPGSDSTNGRKIFFKPSVAYESGYKMLFFGTGDREHPLNWYDATNNPIIDRMYGINDKDSDQTTTVVEDHADNTHELVDVTTNYLQACTTDCSQLNSILSNLDTLFGWYIKLNETFTNNGVTYSGEKVLAPALVFNKVAYYTTYAPSTVVVGDPCLPGNLGIGRLYAVDYKTGEAVMNYDTGNSSDGTNTRSLNSEGEALLRSDRVMTLGSGIPSGIVVIVGAGGDSQLLIGCGGAICSADTSGGGTIIPLYWRQR